MQVPAGCTVGSCADNALTYLVELQTEVKLSVIAGLEGINQIVSVTHV